MTDSDGFVGGGDSGPSTKQEPFGNLIRTGITSRHETAHLKSWRGLFALAAYDLGVDLIGARIKQVHCPILQRPEVAIQGQVVFALGDPLTRDQLRGFEPYCRCLYHHRLGASRAGRQAKADQPTCEQPDSYA